jgi:RNase H-fold protein (predicted Holliday junction resolvase)
MQKFLKEKWKIILVIILALFGLNKCTQSCNRQGKIDQLELEYSQLDSIYKTEKLLYEDSLKNQQNRLDILEERVNGLKNMNEAVSSERSKTDEANKRASEASKREQQLRKQLNISK